MGPTVDESLLRELALPVVVEAGPPGEAEIFPMLSDAYFADPERALSGDGDGGGPLSIGTSEVVVMVTPVVLAAMTEAVRYVAGEAAKRGVSVTGRALRRLFGRNRAPADGPTADGATGDSAAEALTLTAAQWAEIRRLVETVVKRAKVPPDRAKLIADAVVGQGRLPDDPR